MGRHKRIPDYKGSGKLQAVVVERSQTFLSGMMEMLWVKKGPISPKK